MNLCVSFHAASRRAAFAPDSTAPPPHRPGEDAPEPLCRGRGMARQGADLPRERVSRRCVGGPVGSEATCLCSTSRAMFSAPALDTLDSSTPTVCRTTRPYHSPVPHQDTPKSRFSPDPVRSYGFIGFTVPSNPPLVPGPGRRRCRGISPESEVRPLPQNSTAPCDIRIAKGRIVPKPRGTATAPVPPSLCCFARTADHGDTTSAPNGPSTRINSAIPPAILFPTLP